LFSKVVKVSDKSDKSDESDESDKSDKSDKSDECFRPAKISAAVVQLVHPPIPSPYSGSDVPDAKESERTQMRREDAKRTKRDAKYSEDAKGRTDVAASSSPSAFRNLEFGISRHPSVPLRTRLDAGDAADASSLAIHLSQEPKSRVRLLRPPAPDFGRILGRIDLRVGRVKR